MWAFHIVGSLNKVVEQFRTPWGYALSVLTYRQKHGQWQSVSWSATQVTKTAIATPVDGGSIEVTDLIITVDKTQGGTVTLTLEDGTNTETLLNCILSDAPLRLNHAVAGRMKGWRDAILYYTVAGANSTGSIIVGYIKNTKPESQPYDVWNSER